MKCEDRVRTRASAKAQKPSDSCSGQQSEGGATIANGTEEQEVLVIEKVKGEDGLLDEEEEDWDACLQKEEEHLKQEREAKEDVKEDSAQVEGVLSDDDLSLLDNVLNQTGLYTQFLAEALVKLEEGEMIGMKENNEKGNATGTKRRKEHNGENGASKRQKTGVYLTPTQKMLPLVEGELREYQLRGVCWLVSLYKNGLNGILADEMGLGKTIQTIGLFAYLRSKRIWGPYMVIAPLSTIGNWVSEFQRFAPSIPCLLYHGDKKDRARLRATKLSDKITESFPVIITTYEIVMNDIGFFMKLSFKSLIVDEGHRLKNHKCKLIRNLRALSAGNKVLLTGTPLQNTLSELWSILNFILPDVFPRLADFESWFDFSAARQGGGDEAVVAMEQRNKVVSKLHSILKPFFLRRLKNDVDVNLKLPGKQEVILYAPMVQYQKDINLGLVDRSLMDRLQQEKAKNGSVCVSTASLRHVFMQMRKNCNHPDLVEGGYDGSITYPPVKKLLEQCGKLQLLHRVLTQLKKGNHRVLIFSQMKRMLDILDYYMLECWEEACRIDGSVGWKDRQEQIKRFNDKDGPFAFLLSTRAGGLGINLTAADTVIIYDSDWNPQQDLQAMDRCHRIGQQKPVLVLRLITTHSVEVKMIQRAVDKMVLERLVMKKGAFQGHEDVPADKPTSMTAEELLGLLQSDVILEDISQSSAVSNKDLNQILNREHLVNMAPLPYSQTGIGYEVVIKPNGAPCGNSQEPNESDGVAGGD